MRPWPHFTDSELRCRCGCGAGWQNMDGEFMEMMERLRWHLGHPLIVASAYRCPAHNAAVSNTGPDGPHTTGRAVDIALSGPRVMMLVHAALTAGFTGIGLKQHGPHDQRLVHLDTLTKAQGFPRPALWTYP